MQQKHLNERLRYNVYLYDLGFNMCKVRFDQVSLVILVSLILIFELWIHYINEFGQPPSLRDKDYINLPSLAWTCWDSEGARRGGGINRWSVVSVLERGGRGRTTDPMIESVTHTLRIFLQLKMETFLFHCSTLTYVCVNVQK